MALRTSRHSAFGNVAGVKFLEGGHFPRKEDGVLRDSVDALAEGGTVKLVEGAGVHMDIIGGRRSKVQEADYEKMDDFPLPVLVLNKDVKSKHGLTGNWALPSGSTANGDLLARLSRYRKVLQNHFPRLFIPLLAVLFSE